MIVVAVLLALCLAYAGTQLRFYVRRRKLLQQSWDDVLIRVKPVNIAAISEIADNFLHPSRSQLRIEPDEMWERIGKMDGLERLATNAEAMLDLAVYAAQWNRVEGRIVGEMIRRDAVRLRKAVRVIELAMFSQLVVTMAPFQLQEAIAAYHLMRGRLLGLYEVAHVGLHPRLAEVL